MVNLSQSTKFIFAQALLALLLILHPVITSACNPQSSSKQSCLTESPAEAIQKLKIDGRVWLGIFNGTFFNSNDNFHITQLVVSMTPVHDGHFMHMHADMPHDPKIHHI